MRDDHDALLPSQNNHGIDIGNIVLDRGTALQPGAGHRFPHPRRRSPLRPLLTCVRAIVVLAGVCALGVLLVVPLGWKEQALAGSALIGGAVLLSGISRSTTVTLALIGASIFSTLRYGYWRTVETWNGMTSAGHLHQWDTVFVVLLLFAEFYAFATLALGYFQTLRPLRRPAVPLPGHPHDWPTVDVMIPTYNEPLDVVRATVLGALALDYPADKVLVFVLDDGRRTPFREWTAEVGAEYIARNDNAHAKAGNINHALGHTNGEFIAIFDSDHVPTRSFLRATLGWFDRDSRLGLVQTPHHFYSPDPFERNLGQFRKVPNEGALFHRLVQDGNDLWNASFFCGSCAVLRRRALEEIGGIAVETVTEDAHTALRLQRRGWNTAYINIPLAAGLATESLSAHIGQRIRWARGMVQILRTENPLLASGLSLSQRLCYFNATTHFLFAVPRLIFLTVPLTYLLLGMVNIYGYSLAVFAYALPHLVIAHLTNARIQSRHRSSFWNEIYEAVLAPYILFPTLLALVNPRLGRFNVTAKGGIVDRTYFDHRIALPFIVLLGLNVAGLVMAYQRYVTDPAHHDTVIMNAVWTIYNVLILSVAASVARERRQRRAEVRVDVAMPLTLVTSDGHEITGMSGHLSRGGTTAYFSRRVTCRPNTPVTLVLDASGSQCALDARVVSTRRRELHLSFARVDTAQERFLVDAMYSRPAAWLTWDDRRADSPLRSLGRILWLSLRGIVVVLAGIITPPRARRRLEPERRGERRTTAVTAPLLALGLLTVSPHSIRAAQMTKAPTGGLESLTFHEVYQLGEIAGQEPGALRGAGASLNFFWGVPVTKIIGQATLTLRYRAPLVAPNESRLDLLLNGTRIGAVVLVAGPTAQMEIPLPTDLLTTDNALSLRLEGSCAACVHAGAPWVTVDLTSRLATSGSRLLLANDLALLPIPFFDSGSQRSWRLPVLFSDPPDADEVAAAAIVASWFGVASDVRGVRFPVTVGELPVGNALVIARRHSAIETALRLPVQSGALIAIRDNPHDPYGKLLILAGETPRDLVAAARALVTSDLSRLHTDTVRARDVPLTTRRQYDAPRWLRTDRPAPIGLYTSADRLKLIGSGSINIYLRLPPDLFLAARQSVPLLLRFEYAGVARGSRAALHLRVNQQDVDSIRLDASSGPVRREEIVRLPTGRLRPYANTLTVDVDLGQRDAGAREVPQYAIVDRESSIDLRGLPHSVVLPRLELLVDAGYPFTAWPDLSRTALVVSNAPTPAEYETLLNMAGFFGAQTGSTATALSVTLPEGVDQVRGKDLVVIGTPASQPLLSAWAGRMPLALRDGRLQLNGALTDAPSFRKLWPFLDEDLTRLRRLVRREAPLDVVVEQFVSPFRPDRSVVAIVPGDSGGEVAAAMFTAARNGPVYGSAAVAREGRFESFLPGVATYHSGRATPSQRIDVLLVEHYWLIPPVVLLFALVIGSAVRDGVERVAVRRLIARRTNQSGGWPI